MNKKIISGFLMFALAVFSMSSFVACKDYDEDSYDDLKLRLNKEISLREALDAQVKALQEAIAKIKSCTCDPSQFATQEDLKNYATKDDLKNYVTLEEYKKAYARLDSIAEALKKLTPGTGKDYDADIKKLYENDSLMVVKMNEINSWIVYVQNLAKQDSIRIDSLSGVVSGWGTTITTLYTRVDSLIQELKHQKPQKDTIYISGGGCDSLCAAKIAKAQFTADSALLIAEKALVLAVHNASRIAALENYVNTLATSGELADEVRWLNQRIDNLLDQMVTGIIIQGTESPVIGYFNTPLDVRSQILAAYYGEVTSTVHFPSGTTGDYVDPSMIWTERQANVMGINPKLAEGNIDIQDRFVSQKDGKDQGNAGTLYLTLNPAEVDFEGKQLSLENSKGEAAAITLENLKKSDRELTFGYTRAANNGFYEAAATLTKENIDAAKIKIDYTTLESEAKAIIKEKSKSSVLNFGAALINSMQDVMPAYAVKATWTSPYNTYNYTTKDYNVYSQYGIAATAIKPLSYAFLKDFNAKFPGEQRILNLLNEIMKKINININLNLPDFSKYQGAITFQNIDLSGMKNADGKIVVNFTYTLKDADGNTLYVLVTTSGGKYAWKAGDGRLYDASTGALIASDVPVEATSISINADVDLTNTLQQIIDQINAQFGASSDLATTITSLLNDVASLGSIDDKINKAIADAKDDIKSVISSYITKVYNKLNGWIQTIPNKALQPTMMAVNSKNKAGILSQSLYLPTKATSSLTLIPTSYTLETLAPAYKKFVAVTDVFDATTKAALPLADAQAKAAAANGGNNMMKVIDSEKSCTLAGEVGYIYEVTYSAVDYHGKVVNKRFYVQF
ncbi:MAG: hypothetical protein E7107_05195 [Prevotella sp.]|nr:hypothetical protein [Prevotella sp.]